MAADEAPQAPPAAQEEEFDAESAFERLAGAKCRVERILLVGLERTKSPVVEAELVRVKHARTLEEVRDAALRAYEELMALDVFDAVDLVVGEGNKVGSRRHSAAVCCWVLGALC